MTYKSVIITKKGGPEVLQIKENKLRPPNKNEVQIRVLACGVGRTDIAMRYGYYPFAPKIPFVPGYEIVGIIEAVGTEVTQWNMGDRVAALTVHGGYSEYIYLESEHLVKVPDTVKSDEAVALILNYVTAYQMLKRHAKIKQGNTIIVTGASGGVGTALLELARLEHLNVYALASKPKHQTITQLGAIPIDYKTNDWETQIRKKEADGLDFVFDGIGNSYINKCFRLLRKGGKLVEFGYPNFLGMLKGYLKIMLLNWIPNGKSASFYGISGTYAKDPSSILADIKTLLSLLETRQINPIISHRIPLLKAAEANQLLENGSVSGKIVLVSPEIL